MLRHPKYTGHIFLPLKILKWKISDLKKFFVHPHDFTLEYIPWLKN